MKVLRYLTLVLLALLVVGCGTATYQRPLPNDAVKKSNFFVYRKFASPTAWSLNFDINGERIAKLAQHTKVEFYVEPGEHKFAISWPLLAGGVNVEGTKKVESGREYYFFIDGSFEVQMRTFKNTIRLYEVPESSWRAEVSLSEAKNQ